MTSAKDISYMNRALELAAEGLGRTAPNPAVGCVIVKDGKVIAEARTADGGRPHAEAVALSQCDAKGADIYVSMEPCAHARETGPCVEALVKARVKRVVIACTDPDPRTAGKGISMLKTAGIEVVTGVLENEARALNKGFFLKVLEQRPLVTLKVAATKDGKITNVSGGWVTGEAARENVHLERSRHDAILVGIGTVLADDPLLTTRVKGVEHKSARVVLDSGLKIPLDSKLVESAKEMPLWVFYTHDPEKKAERLKAKNVKLLWTDKLSVRSALRALAEAGITRLFVEGGAAVHAAFVREGFGDRLLWYAAPTDSGGGLEAFGGLKQAEILKRLGLKQAESRKIGEDLLEIYEKAA